MIAVSLCCSFSPEDAVVSLGSPSDLSHPFSCCFMECSSSSQGFLYLEKLSRGGGGSKVEC